MLTPYYNRNGIQIYCGDCREILPELSEDIYMTITDPPWPGCTQTGDEGLFPSVVEELTRLSPRLAVIIGCDSDPRWLKVPITMPFFVACWMSRIPPTPKGYKWYSGEVAYVFGEGFRNDTRATLMSSELKYASMGHRMSEHPCPRNGQAMLRFIGAYTRTGDTVLDPFMGIGTALVAAKSIGRKAIGIEIEERWCAEAVKKLAQEVMEFR